MIAKILCKSTDDCHALILVDREGVVVVFEEDCATFCGTSCKGVVCFKVLRSIVGFTCFALVCKLQHAEDDFVKFRFVKCAVLDSLDDMAVVHTLVAGHFKVVACLD